MHNTPEREPDPVLKVARRCEWAGVACLFALAALIVSSSSMGTNLSALGVPRALEAFVAIGFYVSWLIAGFGLLLRSSELGLEARAGTPAQRKALHKVNVFRRLCVSALVAAPVLWFGLRGSGPLLLLPLLACAGLWLQHRVGEMVRRILG